MKQLILIISLVLNFNAYSQDDKTVTLVVSGQGKTQEEAKQNALRSAIEQAFGTFISSKTEILNDNLVKDEIVSISNGNIQKFDIISEVQIPDGGYATTLKATVSVTKLTSFVESKGVEVEFKGSLFGANLRQQKLNEEAEYKAILNLCKTSNEILSKSLDYSIKVGQPAKTTDKNNYYMRWDIEITPNLNFDKFSDFFSTNLKSIAMSDNEIDEYKKINKDIYGLHMKKWFYFRSSKTATAIQNLFLKSNQYIHNFQIITNLDTFYIKEFNLFTKSDIPNGYYGQIYSYDINDGDKDKFIYRRVGVRGYPLFEFYSKSHEYGIKFEANSSWKIYSFYWNNSKKIEHFFNKENYFVGDRQLYYPSWSKLNYDFPVSNRDSRNSFAVPEIGFLELKKINYHCSFIAIYSEDQISKLSNISVKPIK